MWLKNPKERASLFDQCVSLKRVWAPSAFFCCCTSHNFHWHLHQSASSLEVRVHHQGHLENILESMLFWCAQENGNSNSVRPDLFSFEENACTSADLYLLVGWNLEQWLRAIMAQAFPSWEEDISPTVNTLILLWVSVVKKKHSGWKLCQFSSSVMRATKMGNMGKIYDTCSDRSWSWGCCHNYYCQHPFFLKKLII